MDEVKGIKLWHIVAVLLFAVVCTLIRAVTEPPKPPEPLPKSAEEVWEEVWNEKTNQPPLTDKEVEALIKYLKELE